MIFYIKIPLYNVQNYNMGQALYILTRGRPGAWETDLAHFIINGNIN
jgi:hypothetical protein